MISELPPFTRRGDEMRKYQQRVVDEKTELDTKRKDLRTFMHGDVYAALSATQQGLLMVQLVAMDNYSDALA